MLIAFSVILVLVAVLTKVVGCGLGAKMCRYSNKNAIRIGTGMISRGEVALIVAAKGDSVGLMSASLLGPVVVVVVITTIISPILLKLAFSHSKKKIQEPEEYVSNDLAKVYEDEDIGNQYTGTRE